MTQERDAVLSPTTGSPSPRTAKMDEAQKEGIVKGLTLAMQVALLSFPEIRDAQPHRWIAAVTFGNLWRKLTKHRGALIDLETIGLVERRVSRGETLWRPTRPLGLLVRARLSGEGKGNG